MRVFVAAVIMATAMPFAALAQAPVTVSIATPNPVVKVGETVKVVITAVNVSHQVHFVFKAPAADGHAEAGCTVFVMNSHGKKLERIDGRPIVIHGKVHHLPMGWISRRVVKLTPGKTSVDFMILNRLFDLSRPGTYFVKVAEEVLTYAPDGKASFLEIPSNTITIKVRQ